MRNKSGSATAATASTSFVTIFKPNPGARLRLFCFPFAGGSSASFRSWISEFPLEVQEITELCAVRLPGHEMRPNETLASHIDPIVRELLPTWAAYGSLPFVFFGHSMGTLVSFELARELRRWRMPGPVHMVVSGHRAPQLPDPRPGIHALADSEFLEALRSYGGTPDAVLENPELIQLFMPVLRADFSVCETYKYRPEEPLDCPITAFGGLDDPTVTPGELAAWKAQTRQAFSLRMFPGDHFFLRSSQTLLLRMLAHELKQVFRRLR